MAQEVLNSTENINVPHGISFWFQENFTGDYNELGDIVVEGVSITPEFLPFRSYRNGVNSERKRLLTQKNASITMTLNEPSIRNLQRALFGGTVASGQSIVAFDGRHISVQSNAQGEYVDLVDAGEDDFGNIVVTGIFLVTDVLEATNLLSANINPDTDGKAFFDATDVGAGVGATVYVRYEHTVSSMFSSEIFGADDAIVDGAGRLQARNQQGGVIQIWDIKSVHLAANGDLPYALDAVQTIPIIATLQERSGTFGTIYTK